MLSVTHGSSIRTTYLGPTNNRGSRIKAQLNVDGTSITIPYPYELSGVDCHIAALKALCAKLDIVETQWVYAYQPKGYIFISVEK